MRRPIVSNQIKGAIKLQASDKRRPIYYLSSKYRQCKNTVSYILTSSPSWYASIIKRIVNSGTLIRENERSRIANV